MDFVNGAFRLLGSVVRALSPKNVARTVRELPLYTPLALRSVRRRLLRYLLVGLCLGAGIIVFLALSAAFRGTALNVAGRTEDLVLPADVVALDLGPGSVGSAEALGWVSQAGTYELFDRWQCETSLGTRWAIGLADDSGLWQAAGVGDRPGPGEVLVPESLAQACSLAPGDVVKIGVVAGLGFTGGEFRVRGVFGGEVARDALLGEALLLRLPDVLSLRAELGAAPVGPGGEVEPNAVAVRERDAGDRRRLIGRVREIFPGATLWWPELPSDRAYRAVGGFLSPGNVILALVFVMAGLGVFNVMLLTLLQRKVQLGVLKALGSLDEEVFLLLLLEGSFTAAGGTALGLVGGALLVRFVDRTSIVPLSVTTSSVAWALVLAIVSFLLAAWLPATLCRRATPIQLMAGRRLYLNPRSTCAQCGRCGGF